MNAALELHGPARQEIADRFVRSLDYRQQIDFLNAHGLHVREERGTDGLRLFIYWQDDRYENGEAPVWRNHWPPTAEPLKPQRQWLTMLQAAIKWIILGRIGGADE